MRRFLALILVLAMLPCAALADLTIYFLDVGQGDCAFIECDNEWMVIDGGLASQSQKVHNFMENHDITRLSYMIATHPDKDHIGGLAAALQAAKVGYIFSPVTEDEDNSRFVDMKKYADLQNTKIKTPYDEQVNYLGDAKIIFYNCGNEKKNIVRSAIDRLRSIFVDDEPEENKENNDMSLVVKIVYADTSFLFTGDIEEEAENRLLGYNIELKTDLLKVAHHGSKSSTSDEFLRAVNPQYAVISSGENKKYNHPNQETLDKLKNNGIGLYRTDLQGMIICKSDGHTITFETDRKGVNSTELFKAPAN